MRAIFLQLLFLIGLAQFSWASGGVGDSVEASPDHVAMQASFAGWLDPSGTATVDTVQQQATWESFSGWKGWAFGPEPVWVRVHVPAVKSVQAPPWVLVVSPPFLDRVDFYDPARGVSRRAGDFYPASDDILGSVLFTFEVPADTTDRVVLLRLQSTSARQVHLALQPLPVAEARTRWVEWVTGSVWILSLVFLVWSLVQWWLTRDRLMGIFVIKQGLISLWGFLFLGFARLAIGEGLPDGWLSQSSGIVAAFMVASSAWFFAALIGLYQPRPWTLTTLRAGSAATAGLSLLHLGGWPQQALQLTNTAAPLLSLWILLTLVLARRPDQRPPISRVALIIYFCIYGAFNTLPSLMRLGLIQESDLLFIGNMSMLVFDGLVMLVILHVRQLGFRAQHQAITTQLMLRQEQARLDQQYMEEQRQLLAMLAHEMKTPLANLRIWMEAGPEGRPVMERAIQDMNHVIERCVHSGQISDQSLQPRSEWLDAAELTLAVLAGSRASARVHLQLPDDVCALQTDAQMLSIVLSNVLENAFKYSAPETAIEIQLQPCPGPDGAAGWRWCVDNVVGEAGLPDPAKVFDKYYRSPHAQRQSGSGLGLFLVKSLVELMRGRVNCIPLDDRVRFECWLPCDGYAS